MCDRRGRNALSYLAVDVYFNISDLLEEYTMLWYKCGMFTAQYYTYPEITWSNDKAITIVKIKAV